LLQTRGREVGKYETEIKERLVPEIHLPLKKDVSISHMG
jgi:hypothetical protein